MHPTFAEYLANDVVLFAVGCRQVKIRTKRRSNVLFKEHARVEWMRSSQAFVGDVYRESCSHFRSVTRSQRKKHSLAVDKLEYFAVDVLRGEECRKGSMVFFPAGKHEYARVSR